MSSALSKVSLGTIAIVSIVLWSPVSESQTPQSPNKASVCTTEAIRFMAGQKITQQMTIKNDGGWCWMDGWAMPSTGMYLSARDLTVTQQPRHGQVTVSDLDNHRIRTAYQPEPDFSGKDSFVIQYAVMNSEKTVQITISK